MIGFGGAFSGATPYPAQLDRVGRQRPRPGHRRPSRTSTNNGNQWTPAGTDATAWNDSLTTLRARCSTCTDAFVAPDAATLASQLQAIIDQGASDGDFNAQQSITESVYEYVDLARRATVIYDAAKPGNRYKAIVPTRFISSFSLPGFKGQQKAFQNNGAGGTVQKWSAGDVLFTQVVDRR